LSRRAPTGPGGRGLALRLTVCDFKFVMVVPARNTGNQIPVRLVGAFPPRKHTTVAFTP
jgi:hypothetical protein